MPNKFISVKEIARQALPRLIENLVFPNLVHQDYSDDFVKGKGATIQIKKPVILTASEFDSSKGTQPQDTEEESVDVTLDKLATVDVEYSAIESATSVDDINRLFIEPAAVALAEKINRDGLEVYRDIPSIVGKAGTTVSTLNDLASVRKVLNDQKVPLKGRKAVWDSAADANLITIPAIVNAEKSGTTEALREGSLGRVMSLDNYMSQAVKNHVKGTLASSGSTKIVVKADITSAEKVMLAASASGTLTGTVVKGDILTINNKTYVVTAAAEASNNEIEVKVYPAITAVANDVVTILDSHTANLAFNPSAFAFVTRPLTAPSGVECYVTSYNGITLRVVRGYDMKFKKDMLSMDVLYGYKTVYPEMATRVLG